MIRIAFSLLAVVGLSACSPSNQNDDEQITYENKGHELVAEMSSKVGEYQALWDKKDVIYTYRYETPNGQVDISTEKYLFKGELSYGQYQQHDRTFPETEGVIEMAYDGGEYWLKQEGQLIEDTGKIDVVKFKRPTNFYWFTMFQKLQSPGVNYEYLGEENMRGSEYKVVKITYDSKNDQPTDIYQLYINKATKMVDHFLFTVADYGMMEIPFLMELEYEEIDGLLIPTKRRYKKSNWKAEVSDEPWILVTWENIQFDNGLTKADFAK